MVFTIGITFTPLSLGLLGNFGSQISNDLQAYQTNYFGWIASATLLQLIVYSTATALARSARNSELLFLPTGRKSFMLAKMLWPLAISTISIVIFLVVTAFFFPLTFAINFVLLVMSLGFGVLSMTGLSLIGISYQIRYGNATDPVTWGVNILSQFLSGISFPITLLPVGVRVFSYILPQTYIFYFWRISLTRGADASILAPSADLLTGASSGLPFYTSMLAMGLISVALSIAGYIAFRRSVQFARRMGADSITVR